VIFVFVFVGLRPWRLDSRSLRAIEKTKLNSRRIGRQSHQTPKRIDLARNLSLRQSTDSRIAAHLGDRVSADRHQAGFGADSRRRMSRLDAGMPYNNTIKLTCFHSSGHLRPV